MKDNSILVISNNNENGKIITDKIKLLRAGDVISSVTYIEAISVLNTTQPSVILVYCANSDSIGIVKEIRKIKSLDKVPVLFITDTFEENLLLYAFDNGIDDFFFLSDPDSIILMRIFLTLQKAVLYNKIETDNDIMTAMGIVEKETGIYSKERSDVVMSNFFSKFIEENNEDSLFMYLKFISKAPEPVDIKSIATLISKTLRGNDIVAYAKNGDLYLILLNAGIKGAKSSFSRISDKLFEKYEVYAACTIIKESFELTEGVLYEKMHDMIVNGNEFCYINDYELSERAERVKIKDENGKDFKDFQREFFENITGILEPAFAHTKEFIEQNYNGAEALYNISDNESFMILKDNSSETKVSFSYPAYIKLIIDIKNEKADAIPVIRRLTANIDELSAEYIFGIMKNIAEEFLGKTENQDK